MLGGSVGFVMIQVVWCITPNCVAMTLHSFRIPHSPFQGTLCNSNLTKTTNFTPLYHNINFQQQTFFNVC